MWALIILMYVNNFPSGGVGAMTTVPNIATEKLCEDARKRVSNDKSHLLSVCVKTA